LLADGVNPIAEKRKAKAERIAAANRAVTFGEVAEDYYKANSPSWKHFKHINQWRSSILGLTLTGKPAKPDYCRALRALPVSAIDTPDVLSVLKPIWETKPETMGRVRARLAAVFDLAKALQYRSGDNPADVAVIGKVLPVRGKVTNHFASIDYHQISHFMAELRAREGSAPRCLEFLALTATRSAEARGAVWSEIDFDEKVWRIPRERMKTAREHVVPLADPVLDLLHALPREGDNGLIFVGPRPGKALTDLALMSLMRKMGRSEVVHGFRSSFSDWAHETTSYPDSVIEMSLAHAVGDAVKRAYHRKDLREKRARLMADWAKYCMSPPVVAQEPGSNVVGIRGRA
jgi:integrase